MKVKLGFRKNSSPNGFPEDDALKKRIYAFFLDLVFISLLNKTIIYTYVNFLERHLPHINSDVKRNILSEFGKIQLPMYTIIFISYFLISYYISNGKTPAKVMFGLKVQGPDILNENISFKQAFLRSSTYYICMIFGMFLLGLPLISKNKKGIPGIISSTHVYTEAQLKFLKKEVQERFTEAEKSEDVVQLDLFAS